MFLAGAGAHGCKARDYIPSLLSKHAEGSANSPLTELAEKQELFHLLKTMCFRDNLFSLLFASARALILSVT